MFGLNKNVTLSTFGSYRKEDDRYFISFTNYNEQSNEVDITNLEVDSDRRVVLSRNGNSGSHLVIEKDQKNFSHFHTELGEAMLGVKANRILNDLSEKGGRLSLGYAMDLNAHEIFQNNLEITVKEL